MITHVDIYNQNLKNEQNALFSSLVESFFAGKIEDAELNVRTI